MSFNLLSFYLVFLFLFLFSGFFFLPLKIKFFIGNLQKDKRLSLEISIYLPGSVKIASFKKSLFFTPLDLDTAGPKDKEILEKRGKLLKNFLITYLRKRFFLINRYLLTIKWEKIELYFKIGTGDAALTGILTGFLRQIAAFFSVFFPSIYQMKGRPRIYIFPSFLSKEITFFCEAEFYTRGIYFVYYFFLFLWHAIVKTKFQRLWRNDKIWQNIRSKV